MIYFLKKGKIILAADTIVAKGKNIYEKPTDKKDAERILNKLSGKWHEVITGVCLLSKKKKVSFRDFLEENAKFLLNLAEKDLKYYIANIDEIERAVLLFGH